MGQLSTPTEDLIARLTYHAGAPGRILAGFNFKPVPILEGESLADLPAIRFFIPNYSGSFRPARSAEALIEFMVAVAVSREKGMVELARAVERVADAAATKIDGTVFALAGTVKPFEWRTEGNFTVDGS